MTETFEPSGRGVDRTFVVVNDEDQEVAVSLIVKARSVSTDGEETLTETQDFTVYPTQILLKAKSERTVRVRWQGDADLTAERSYRIIAEQVLLKYGPVRPAEPSMAIKMVFRFGGTLYVAPPKAVPEVVVASAKAIETAMGPMLELLLENRGTRHAIIDRPALNLRTVAAKSTIPEAVATQALSGENILAGTSRRVRLPWPSDLKAGPVEAELNARYLR